MILLYIVLIVYILAVNFYSFLYVFAQYKAENQTSLSPSDEREKSNPNERAEQRDGDLPKEEQLSVFDMTSNKQEQVDASQKSKKKEKIEKPKKQSFIKTFAPAPVKGFDWKLLLCGALGGAITIYVCMFIFKYKLNNLLLMIIMPIFSAVNGYLWYLLMSSGFFISA